MLQKVEHDTSPTCSCNARFGQNTGGNDGKEGSMKQGMDFLHFQAVTCPIECDYSYSVVHVAEFERFFFEIFVEAHKLFLVLEHFARSSPTSKREKLRYLSD